MGAVARPEHDLQRAVVKLLRSGILHPDVFWTAINPLPGRTPQAGAQAKQLGVRAGVPDLLFVHEGFSLWVELKAAKRGRVTKEQRALHEKIEEAHDMTGLVKVVTSTAQLLEVLGDMLRVKRTMAA